MKLYLNDASPYARLIRVIVLETGLDSETELVFVDPWASPKELLAVNPASKVPALALPDGSCLIESSCIADYLIVRGGRFDLSSFRSGSEPSIRLELLGLARAAIDSAFGSVIQGRYAKDSPLIERWRANLPRIARRIEVISSNDVRRIDIDLADLTVATAFEYVDFRLPEINWRNEAPALAERVARLGDRASFRATRPK